MAEDNVLQITQTLDAVRNVMDAGISGEKCARCEARLAVSESAPKERP